ncbi:hypothetical protein VNO78_03912 [Psophocarpus tetragonolobus]|uniref:Uncharacterized protein n=1 Tax=Psophocarpus tetragonolobus TaxID=3891 RepID=A0AAN9TE49_PSOTE
MTIEKGWEEKDGREVKDGELPVKRNNYRGQDCDFVYIKTSFGTSFSLQPFAVLVTGKENEDEAVTKHGSLKGESSTSFFLAQETRVKSEEGRGGGAVAKVECGEVP